jgi:hypothetical protein
MNVTLPEGAGQLIALLELHRHSLPFADAELARHRALHHAIDAHQERGAVALNAWREALSRRWECEVHSQRVYSATMRQLHAYYGADTSYAQLVAPGHPNSPMTPADLLVDMRRLAASIALLSPQPPFAEEHLHKLHTAAIDLAATIEWTDRCETERRNIQLEQRLTVSLYQRACDKTRRLISSHVSEQGK